MACKPVDRESLARLHRQVWPECFPKVGDRIALDWDGNHPHDHGQGISWYCSTVTAIDGSRYQVSYDSGLDRWYTFDFFGKPKHSHKDGGYMIYPALPPEQGSSNEA